MNFEWRDVWVPESEADALRLRHEWEKTLADIDYWADTHGPAATGYAGKMHLGSGMSRLSAMATLLARSSLAGREYETTVVRDLNGASEVHLHLAADAQNALEEAALHTDRLASAVAIEVAFLQESVDILLDGKLDAQSLRNLASDINGFGRKFPERVKREMTRLPNSDDITDLRMIKAHLAERLEAAATGAQKRIKGALSQQAIDNWAACVEVDEALQEIALECSVGALRISNATDGKKAQGAFSAAVKAVEAVSPVNVPEITHAISGRRVTIRAANPVVDPAIRGPVAVFSTSVRSTDGSTITGKITASAVVPNEDSDPLLSHWDFADDYGGKVRIEVEVRNVCGPATHEVDLDVTANGGSLSDLRR